LNQTDEFDHLRATPRTNINFDKYSDDEIYNYFLSCKMEYSSSISPQIILPYIDSKYNNISIFKANNKPDCWLGSPAWHVGEQIY
jgi:hypothetical protein